MEKLTIDDIKEYVNNAKKHPQSQIDALAKIVKLVGWRQPVVVDSTGTIIVGHGRFITWKQNRDELKPIWIIDDAGNTVHGEPDNTPMTEEQVKAYRLADNKLNESGWDMDLLTMELKELSDLDFDISMTGFEIKGIDEDKPEDVTLPIHDVTEKHTEATQRVVKCPECGHEWVRSHNVKTIDKSNI